MAYSREDMGYVALPTPLAGIKGLAPIKTQEDIKRTPYGGLINTTKADTHKIDQTTDYKGQPLPVPPGPSIHWPSSEHAFHGQKLLFLLNRYLPGGDLPDPDGSKARQLEMMIDELAKMKSAPGQELSPRADWDPLIERNKAVFGVSSKAEFDALCYADYHAKLNPMGHIEPTSGLPYTYFFMKHAVQMKLEQNSDLKEMAIEFAKRGIFPVEVSQYDSNWSSLNGDGRNLLGIIILELGNQYLPPQERAIPNPHAAYAQLQSQQQAMLSHGYLEEYATGRTALPQSASPIAAPTVSSVASVSDHKTSTSRGSITRDPTSTARPIHDPIIAARPLLPPHDPKDCGSVHDSVKEASASISKAILNELKRPPVTVPGEEGPPIIRRGIQTGSFKFAFQDDEMAKEFVALLKAAGIPKDKISYKAQEGGERYPMELKGNVYDQIVRIESPADKEAAKILEKLFPGKGKELTDAILSPPEPAARLRPGSTG